MSNQSLPTVTPDPSIPRPAERVAFMQSAASRHCTAFESCRDGGEDRQLRDWGGQIGSVFAIRHPDRIKCLCICNGSVPWANSPVDPPRRHKWLDWTNSDQYEPVILNLGSTVLSVMQRIGMERLDHVDETWLRAYGSPFPTPESCRGALQFPRNISDAKTYEFYEELSEKHDIAALQAIPAMCVVGEEERTMPAELRAFGFIKPLAERTGRDTAWCWSLSARRRTGDRLGPR